MAKQSGLHQLRGKVGEHSYYRQTGIVPGLVRSINQGLSSRVKTGIEYANTRLNNAEFGAAAGVAGLLGKMVTPKYRPMILPFSQSKMAKDILEIARQRGGSWGQRVVTSADTAALCETLTKTSKLVLSDFVSANFSREDSTTLEVAVNVTELQSTALAELGISGVAMSIVAFGLATGKYVAAEGGIHKSNYRIDDYSSSSVAIVPGESASMSESISIPATFTPDPDLYNGHRIAVLVLMPYRTINSVRHTLQEYCSFVAVPIPDAE